MAIDLIPNLDSNPVNPIREMEANSSWIAHVKYDSQLQQLTVSTKKGKIYRSDGVSSDVADQIFTASSTGSAYNDLIVGKGYSGAILA